MAATTPDRMTAYVTGFQLRDVERWQKSHPQAPDIDVVDVWTRPDLAREARVLVVPTIVRSSDEGERRIIGGQRVRELLSIAAA